MGVRHIFLKFQTIQKKCVKRLMNVFYSTVLLQLWGGTYAPDKTLKASCGRKTSTWALTAKQEISAQREQTTASFCFIRYI